MNWNSVKKVGNPKQEGEYIVTIEYPETEWDGGDEPKKIGEMKREVTTRYFGPVGDGLWRMFDQPTEGLVWHEQSGSWWHERVVAWIPFENSAPYDGE